jgi:predicted DNA-binding protein with PD1-like motif
MKYKLLNDGPQKTFAVILNSGEETMQCLKTFATEQRLHAASFTAVGAFSDTTVGFFDFAVKDYKKIAFKEQMEVLSVTGDISLYEDKPKIHAHVVLGRADGSAHGGHLVTGIVHPTLELILTETPAYLKREMDEDSGIPLIKIE